MSGTDTEIIKLPSINYWMVYPSQWPHRKKEHSDRLSNIAFGVIAQLISIFILLILFIDLDLFFYHAIKISFPIENLEKSFSTFSTVGITFFYLNSFDMFFSAIFIQQLLFGTTFFDISFSTCFLRLFCFDIFLFDQINTYPKIFN